MNSEILDSPHPAPGTDAATTLDDRHTLHSIILNNYSELTDLAHVASHHKIFFSTPEAIVGKLFDDLARYGGPPSEADFMRWARRFVTKEAARYEITGRILADHDGLIHDAINKSMWTSAVDLAVEHQDIYWEIVWLIFQRAHSLDSKGSAKLSTRLYSLVDKHVYLFHNKKNASRRKLVQLRRHDIQCEYLSDAELAAMRAAESDDAAYDPGYAEAGLSMY